MKLLLLIAAALLAGCATTPKEVMQDGERADYRSAKPVPEAAKCIEHNAAELKWGLLGTSFQAQTRAAATAGTLEVIYGGQGATVAVVSIRADGTGSAISVWRSPQLIGLLRGEGTLEQQIVRGC